MKRPVIQRNDWVYVGFMGKEQAERRDIEVEP